MRSGLGPPWGRGPVGLAGASRRLQPGGRQGPPPRLRAGYLAYGSRLIGKDRAGRETSVLPDCIRSTEQMGVCCSGELARGLGAVQDPEPASVRLAAGDLHPAAGV